MASACLNSISPEMTSSYTWLNPRLRGVASSSKKQSDVAEKSDLSDFEFRLEDPVRMQPADELFSDGKLVPLQMTVKLNERGEAEVACAPRWKELLGFGRRNNNNNKTSNNANGRARSVRQLLQRNSSSGDASVNVPLLSSSSNHSLDDLPRLSLDSDRPKTRVVNTRPDPRAATRRSAEAVTVDSPRMNSSGKVVFQHLERSSSSPSSFNGGPRYKHKSVMERSFSANVRITNVPVCSLRGSASKSVFGFPMFSRPPRGEASCNRSQRFYGKSKTDSSNAD